MAAPVLFGAHDSIAGGLHNAVAEAVSLEADCMQIFCKNQRQWNAKPLTDDDVALFRGAVKEAAIGPVMVHDSYLINMGAPDDTKRENARQAFMAELDRCEQLGIPYLNFHPGSHTHADKKLRDDHATRRACLDRIASAMLRCIDETKGWSTRLVIENAAGQGTNVGMTWEEVGTLADAVGHPDRVGVCVDTQHAWAAGHDWLEDYDGVWDAFDDRVGLKRLVAFHLNDSKQPLGARVDRHDNIPEGHLGEGFWSVLVNDARFKQLPGYLETPGGPDVWREEIKYLRSLDP